MMTMQDKPLELIAKPERAFYYSLFRNYIIIAIGVIVAVSLLAYGLITKQLIDTASGIVLLVFLLFFALGIRRKLRATNIALAVNNGFLVGGELAQSLPISETTFDIKPDYNGSWVVCLYCHGKTIRLGAGGWRMGGERYVSKAVVERELLAWGIQRQSGH